MSKLRMVELNTKNILREGLLDVLNIARSLDIELKVTKRQPPPEIQRMSPSPDDTFTLIYDGIIASHHCTGGTRFKTLGYKN